MQNLYPHSKYTSMNTYSFSTVNNTGILTLTSLLDPNENQAILQTLLGELEKGTIHWIVDLQYMSFLNSTGLNFLISLLTRTRTKGGDIVLIGVNERIEQVFVLTRLHSMFQMQNSQEAALLLLHQTKNNITES